MIEFVLVGEEIFIEFVALRCRKTRVAPVVMKILLASPVVLVTGVVIILRGILIRRVLRSGRGRRRRRISPVRLAAALPLRFIFGQIEPRRLHVLGAPARKAVIVFVKRRSR